MFQKPNYRPHIDGLRAVAVVGVIAFHLKFFTQGATTVPGGFTGVDVFFVISGYLISKIVISQAGAGVFSFADFYARRARRILPALCVMLCLTLIVGYFLLHPFEYERMSVSLLAAVAFCANLFFYAKSDYFAPAASELPLLHLWSLGVEEQFYLLLPLAVVALRRFKKIAIAACLAVLACSLIASQSVTAIAPPAAFFLLPFRAFELLIGTALAVIPWRSDRQVTSIVVSAAGLLMIGASYLFLRESMRFPGFAALPACIGAALVIWSGGSRILGSDVFSYIGRISYPLYLYHWPIIVFAKRYGLDGAIGIGVTIGLTVALAILSYHGIEQPIRRLRFKSIATLAYAGLTTGAVAAIAGIVMATSGFAWRVDSEVARYSAYLKYINTDLIPTGPSCFLDPTQKFEDLRADCLAPSKKPIVLLWGDSTLAQHTTQLTLAAATRGYDLRQATASACPPGIGLEVLGRPHCRDFNDKTLQRILALHPALVILSSLRSGQDDVIGFIEQSIARLKRENIEVLALGLGPMYKKPVPIILADRMRDGNASLRGDDELSDYVETNNRIFKTGAERAGARYLSVFDIVCKDGCPLTVGKVPAHYDIHHGTAEGSARVVHLIADQLFNVQR